MAIFVLLACATSPFSAGGVGGGGGGDRDLLLPEGLGEDDESVDAVGDRLTALKVCSLVVSGNTAMLSGICLPFSILLVCLRIMKRLLVVLRPFVS